MKHIFVFLIRLYQKTLSPDHGLVRHIRSRPTCRFHPTCSQYAIEAIERFGVIGGLSLAIKRLSRCHPWNPGGVDPVPPALKES